SIDLPKTFLVSLDEPASGFSSDAAGFFGVGGPSAPSGLKESLNSNLEESGTHAGLLVERKLHLGPGESRPVSFLYGYLPDGFTLEALIAKYEGSSGSVFPHS